MKARSFPRPARRHGIRGVVGVGVARSIGRLSRLWGQWGLGTIYKHVGRLPGLSGARCTVEILPGSFFETGVFEPYWAPTVMGGRAYEPELVHALERMAPLGPTFIDCGANFGY